MYLRRTCGRPPQHRETSPCSRSEPISSASSPSPTRGGSPPPPNGWPSRSRPLPATSPASSTASGVGCSSACRTACASPPSALPWRSARAASCASSRRPTRPSTPSVPGAPACCVSPPTRPGQRPSSPPPPRGSTTPSRRSSSGSPPPTRAEGLRRLADGATDLHCGGIDGDEPLPDFLRRERFLDMTAGVVAWSGHPLLAAKVTRRDLSRYPWIDFDWPATPSPRRRPPVARRAPRRPGRARPDAREDRPAQRARPGSS